jgi:Methyltransferase domain
MKEVYVILSPDALHEYLHKFEDEYWEPGFDEYKEHLAALNRITMNAGVPIEGSLFYDITSESNLPPVPFGDFLPKRRNFAFFCSAGNSLLEVGFNAGHSCLLALTINKELMYTGIDIGRHDYTLGCYEYLKSVFGSRVRLIIGDSRQALPLLRDVGESFDLYHVDGDHGREVFQADMYTILGMGTGKATVLVDDTWLPGVDYLCDYLLMQGRLSRIEFARLWFEETTHRVFRTHPRSG